MDKDIQIFFNNSIEIKKTIEKGLYEHNSEKCSYFTNIYPRRYIGYTAHINDEMVGGVWGYARHNCSWIYIDLLWVNEKYRKRGIASSLIKRIEQHASELGCKVAKVETWDFQAKPFYEILGYSVKAAISDCPPGTTNYIMTKYLGDEK